MRANSLAAVRPFVKLQWRANLASLRGGGRRAAAAAVTVVISVALGLVALVLIPLVVRNLTPGTTLTQVLVGACSLFVVVSVGIATIVGVSNSLDIRVIATEPLTRSQRAFGQLAMEAAGPTGIAVMLAGIGTVIAVSGTIASIPLAVSAVVTLLIGNMLIARVVINLLGLLVDRSPRLGQLVAGLVGLMFMIAYQVAANVLPRVPLDRLRSVADTLGWLPGGSIGRALGGAARGGVGSLSDWLGVAWTAIWIPLLGWLFVRTTERLVAAVPDIGRRSMHDRRAWRRWAGSGAAGAIAFRTGLTTVRSPRRMIEITMGFAVAAASVIVAPLVAADLRGAAVVTGFGACFGVILPMSNMFGSDGPAIANELLAGALGRDLIRGKRRFAAAVGMPLAVVGPLVVAAWTGAWTIWPVNMLVAIAGVFGGSAVAIAQSGWGAYPAPDDVNPFALGGNSGLLAVITWFGSVIALSVVMAPVLIGVGVAMWYDAKVVATFAAAVAVAWAYGAARVAEVLATGYVNRQDRLIDQITPA